MKKFLKNVLIKLRLFGLYRSAKMCFGRATINKELKKVLEVIEKFPRDPKKKLVLITGHIGLQKKANFQKMLDHIEAQMPDVQFLVLDEARRENEGCSVVCHTARIEIPNLYGGARYIYRDEEFLEKIFMEKDYMFQALQSLSTRSRGVFFSQNLLYTYYEIYMQVIRCLHPDLVLVWSKFSATHSVCDAVFKEHGIKVNYLEYGSLPGTYGLESFGQMGESYPAREYKAFMELPVDEQELEHADRVWRYLTESGLNRNVQVQDDVVQRVKDVMKKDRPLIVFAGNLDHDAGIIPYTKQSLMYHSPMFQTSQQALVYLAILAEEYDWNLVFKPHPTIAASYSQFSLPKNVIYIPSGNLNDLIDFSDVVVTLMSQTAYVSCIRKKPVVMLGYNQIRGKECVYEAYTFDQIAPVIAQAIEEGFTQKHQEAFRKHIAQMCKYYLYDDHADREIRYGQDIDKVISYLYGELA